MANPGIVSEHPQKRGGDTHTPPCEKRRGANRRAIFSPPEPPGGQGNLFGGAEMVGPASERNSRATGQNPNVTV